MERVSPNINLHHEIWENSKNRIPIILTKKAVINSKFWRRQDVLVPNTMIPVKKEIETIHLLTNDIDQSRDKPREDEFETEQVLNHDRCIKLSSVLSEDECQNLIKLTEDLGYKSIQQEYVKEYRNSERVVVTSKKMADIIWERIVPYLKKSDFKGVKPYGFDNSGNWIPIGLNPCFRFNKYSENTFFKPHMDAQHCNNDNERSVFTVLIYLDYSHFGTSLLKKVPNPNPQDDETSVMSFQELTYVAPSSGNVLIFNHDLYHAGEHVRYGSKYIIRTEMLFRRIDSESVYRMDYKNSEEYLRVKQLVEESTELEKQGKVRESTLKYLKAHQLQVDLSHSLIADSTKHYSMIEETLPEEIFVHIFKYLPLYDLVKGVLYLNREINEYARNSVMWKEIYQNKWSTRLTINNVHSYNYNYGFQKPSSSNKESSIEIESSENDRIVRIESERTSIFGDSLKDWYQTFVCRANMERSFCPVLLDVGAKNYRFGLAKDNTFLTAPSIAAQPSHPHFHLPNYGMDDIVIGDRYKVACHHCSSIPLISDSGQILSFDNFKVLLYQLYNDDLRVQLKEHPLLLSVSPLWTDSDLEMIRCEAFGLEIPAICFVDSRELISHYYQKPNCLIVHIGASMNICTAIHNNKPLRSTQFSESLPLKKILSTLTNRTDSYSYEIYFNWDEHLLAAAVVPTITEEENYSAYKKFVSEIEPKDINPPNSYSRTIICANDRVSIGQKILLSVLSQITQCIQSVLHSDKLTKEEKQQILQNVVIVGGFSHIQNLTTKLTELITKQYPSSLNISPTFTEQTYQPVANIERKGIKYSYSGGCFDVVGGAKIMASLNNFIDHCTFIDEPPQSNMSIRN